MVQWNTRAYSLWLELCTNWLIFTPFLSPWKPIFFLNFYEINSLRFHIWGKSCDTMTVIFLCLTCGGIYYYYPFFFYGVQVLLYCQDWPETCYVAQAGPQLSVLLTPFIFWSGTSCKHTHERVWVWGALPKVMYSDIFCFNSLPSLFLLMMVLSHKIDFITYDW